MLSSVRGMLADGHDGSVSSKRVITFICVFLMALAFIANLFWGFKVEQFMYDSVMYVVIAGLGATGLEKFAPKAPK